MNQAILDARPSACYREGQTRAALAAGITEKKSTDPSGMRNVLLLLVSLVLAFGVYYGGWATAKFVGQYYPSCKTFVFPDGHRITGWHAVFGDGHHVVQLRTGKYAVFESFSDVHSADKDLECDFAYVRPTVQLD